MSPAAGYEGAEQGRDVGAVDAKGGAGEDGEGDAVAGAGLAVEEEGAEEDGLGTEDDNNSLPPSHAFLDEGASDVVGGEAYDEANPEAGNFPCGRRALRLRGRQEVGVAGEGREFL